MICLTAIAQLSLLYHKIFWLKENQEILMYIQ